MKRYIIALLFMLGSIQLIGLGAATPVEFTGSSQEFRSSEHSYSASSDAAFDGSNSTSAFFVIRGCDSQDCTQMSFYDMDYSFSPTTTVDKIVFEWNIQPYDSFTPSNSQTNLSLYNHSSMNWDLKQTVSGSISDWEIVSINFSNAYLGSNGELDLRISGFHNDTGDFSDELGIWIKEFHLFSNGNVTNDSDFDGIVDSSDDCPYGDTGWTSNSSTDHDGDGCQDPTEDVDDDNDGVDDTNDSFPFNALEWDDFDEDTIGDNADADDDNDGVDDTNDSFPFNALEWADFDEDTIGDNGDADDDNDGVDDTNDSFPFNALEWADFDDDTIGDNADADDDNDGVDDVTDVFPYNSSEWSDNDNDSIGDNADTDDDNDGYSDVDEEQSRGDPNDDSIMPDDWDDDWLSDLVDDDDDNDGIIDVDDDCNKHMAKNWGEKETDRTYSHNSDLDVDSDGCRDSDEDDDDDNDQRIDGDDLCPRGELNWDSHDTNLDFDEDGCRDDKPEDDDIDNDGWTDDDETECGTDSKNALSQPADLDADGICDLLDTRNDIPVDSEPSERCEVIGDWFCDFTAIVEPGCLGPTGFLLALGAVIKTKMNKLRLDEGSERFQKGERRFDHIEDEVEELEELVQSTSKKS